MVHGTKQNMFSGAECKIFIVKFFPPKFITIEIKKDNGEIVNEIVDFEDDEALVEALLRSTGKVIQ